MRNYPAGEQKHTAAILSPDLQPLTVTQDDHEVAPLRGAESDGPGVVSDHDEPPDGQHQGVPDGHPVEDQSEVGVEQEEDGPAVGILRRAIK